MDLLSELPANRVFRFRKQAKSKYHKVIITDETNLSSVFYLYKSMTILVVDNMNIEQLRKEIHWALNDLQNLCKSQKVIILFNCGFCSLLTRFTGSETANTSKCCSKCELYLANQDEVDLFSNMLQVQDEVEALLPKCYFIPTSLPPFSLKWHLIQFHADHQSCCPHACQNITLKSITKPVIDEMQRTIDENIKNYNQLVNSYCIEKKVPIIDWSKTYLTNTELKDRQKNIVNKINSLICDFIHAIYEEECQRELNNIKNSMSDDDEVVVKEEQIDAQSEDDAEYETCLSQFSSQTFSDKGNNSDTTITTSTSTQNKSHSTESAVTSPRKSARLTANSSESNASPNHNADLNKGSESRSRETSPGELQKTRKVSSDADLDSIPNPAVILLKENLRLEKLIRDNCEVLMNESSGSDMREKQTTNVLSTIDASKSFTLEQQSDAESCSSVRESVQSTADDETTGHASDTEAIRIEEVNANLSSKDVSASNNTRQDAVFAVQVLHAGNNLDTNIRKIYSAVDETKKLNEISLEPEELTECLPTSFPTATIINATSSAVCNMQTEKEDLTNYEDDIFVINHQKTVIHIDEHPHVKTSTASEVQIIDNSDIIYISGRNKKTPTTNRPRRKNNISEIILESPPSCSQYENVDRGASNEDLVVLDEMPVSSKTKRDSVVEIQNERPTVIHENEENRATEYVDSSVELCSVNGSEKNISEGNANDDATNSVVNMDEHIDDPATVDKNNDCNSGSPEPCTSSSVNQPPCEAIAPCGETTQHETNGSESDGASEQNNAPSAVETLDFGAVIPKLEAVSEDDGMPIKLEPSNQHQDDLAKRRGFVAVKRTHVRNTRSRTLHKYSVDVARMDGFQQPDYEESEVQVFKRMDAEGNVMRVLITDERLEGLLEVIRADDTYTNILHISGQDAIIPQIYNAIEETLIDVKKIKMNKSKRLVVAICLGTVDIVSLLSASRNVNKRLKYTAPEVIDIVFKRLLRLKRTICSLDEFARVLLFKLPTTQGSGNVGIALERINVLIHKENREDWRVIECTQSVYKSCERITAPQYVLSAESARKWFNTCKYMLQIIENGIKKSDFKLKNSELMQVHRANKRRASSSMQTVVLKPLTGSSEQTNAIGSRKLRPSSSCTVKKSEPSTSSAGGVMTPLQTSKKRKRHFVETASLKKVKDNNNRNVFVPFSGALPNKKKSLASEVFINTHKNIVCGTPKMKIQKNTASTNRTSDRVCVTRLSRTSSKSSAISDSASSVDNTPSPSNSKNDANIFEYFSEDDAIGCKINNYMNMLTDSTMQCSSSTNLSDNVCALLALVRVNAADVDQKTLENTARKLWNHEQNGSNVGVLNLEPSEKRTIIEAVGMTIEYLEEDSASQNIYDVLHSAMLNVNKVYT